MSDDLSLRIVLEEDGGGGQSPPPSNPKDFDIPRFYRRYPDRVPEDRPDITRALSGQSVNIGPPPAPDSYQFYIQKYGPPEPSAFTSGVPYGWDSMATPGQSRSLLGPPSGPSQQLMLPLSSEVPPVYGPPRPPEQHGPPRPPRRELSEFERLYGPHFRNAQEVLEFIQEYDRDPRPGDRPVRPNSANAPMLEIKGRDADFSVLPQSRNSSGFRFTPSDQEPFVFTYGNSPEGLPPGFILPGGFKDPEGESSEPDSGEGGGRGRGRGRRGGGNGSGGGGGGYTFPYTPPEGDDDDDRTSIFDHFRNQLLEPADRYDVSSMAYTVGGAVGRLTGSASLGVMAGGVTRAIGSIGSELGLLSKGAALAIQVFSSAVTMTIGAFESLTTSARTLAEDLAKVNGPLAGTLALENAKDIQRDISIGVESQSNLSAFVRAQGDFNRDFREVKAEFINTLIPIATFFYRSAAIPLKVFNTLDSLLVLVGFKDGGITSAVWTALKSSWPLGPLFSAMENVNRIWELIDAWTRDRTLGSAVEDFLDPAKAAANPNAPWHKFPAAPPQRKGVH